MGRLMKTIVLPSLYLALAAYVWIDFVQLPPDGLANVGLMIVALPITVIGLILSWAVGSRGFVLSPDGFGYYGNHALYYWPSVVLTALLLYWLSRGIWGRSDQRKTNDPQQHQKPNVRFPDD